MNLIADFPKNDITENLSDILPITNLLIRDFKAKKYDKIFVAYMDFMSSLKQLPHVKQLLPFSANIDERLFDLMIDSESIPQFINELVKYLKILRKL